MNDQERITALEKRVAELSEAIQPEKLTATISEQIMNSVKFHNSYWPEIAKNILPKR